MSGSFEWDFSFFSLDGILIYVLAFFPARSTFPFHMLLVPLFCWTGCLRSSSSSTCSVLLVLIAESCRSRNDCVSEQKLRDHTDRWLDCRNILCNMEHSCPCCTNTSGSGKLTKYVCLCQHRPDELFFWSAENLRCCFVPANNGLPSGRERKQFYH